MANIYFSDEILTAYPDIVEWARKNYFKNPCGPNYILAQEMSQGELITLVRKLTIQLGDKPNV